MLTKKRFVNIFLFTTILPFAIITIAFFWLSRPLDQSDDVDIYNPLYYIAHAGGGINGAIYTNSLEAVTTALNNGFEYIELDLYVASDSNVLCLHDLGKFNMMVGENYHSLSTETFKNCRIFEQYTPITLEEVQELWKKNSFYIITDKESRPDILRKCFKSNREKVIVETRLASRYKDLKELGFKPMLSIGKGVAGLIRYLYVSVINRDLVKIAVMPAEQNSMYFRFYKRMGTKVAVYLRNENRQFFVDHLGKDVDWVYTDFWIPLKR